MLWKAMLKVIAILTTGAVGVCGVTRDVTDEEYALFPRLFHLDDYDTCLMQDDGLYCLGVFQITGGTSPAYPLMKEYSEDNFNFNHTRLHRGYCVSKRCPVPHTRIYPQCSSDENIKANNSLSNAHIPKIGPIGFLNYEAKNTSCDYHNHYQDSNSTNIHRFVRCVSKYAQKHNLDVQLSSIQYCHTKQDLKKEWKVETPHLVFLLIVGLILMMNLVGTLYDKTRSKITPENRLLTSWSIGRNWQHMIGPFHESDPRLTTQLPIEGIRCMLVLLVVFVHSGCIHYQLYLGNPKLVEWFAHQKFMKIFQNGHSVVQCFTMLTSFILAQGVLQASTTTSFWILPKFLIKRIFRIAPVYLLALGFAATWWPLIRDGPLWPALVEAESAVCRDKFWAHAFFVGNFVKDHQMCQLQIWYLEVDVQLCVVSLVLLVVLSRARRWALPVLAGLFVLTCVGSGAQAYRAGWAPFIFFSGPEDVRASLLPTEQYRLFYIKPWGSLAACLVGLFLGHLHHQLQENGFDPGKNKWLIITCQMSVVLLPMWTWGAGNVFHDISSRGAKAAFLALERPVMAVLAGVVNFGLFNGQKFTKIRQIDSNSKTSAPAKGFIKHLFSWRALFPLGRMSMSVVMTHWILIKTFAASRRGLYYTSTLDLTVDFLASTCLSYLVALPVTVLLDVPMQQLYRALAT